MSETLPGSVTVTHESLELVFLVRIQARQPISNLFYPERDKMDLSAINGGVSLNFLENKSFKTLVECGSAPRRHAEPLPKISKEQKGKI